MLQPEEQRRHAEEVVRRLRAAGFEAYWAGGCVRDQLLGRVPNDYDVATSAVPRQVRELFGHRRTLAIGAAFGVIAVLGRREAGSVEVTTFRQDAAYSDGRHPTALPSVPPRKTPRGATLPSTGFFYDPVERRVIDFIGGQADLAAGESGPSAAPETASTKTSCACSAPCASRPRSISRSMKNAGRPSPKWPRRSTSSAPSGLPSKCAAFSPTRIGRSASGCLSRQVWRRTCCPKSCRRTPSEKKQFDDMLDVLGRLGGECGFPLALAAALAPFVDLAGVEAVCRRWRLSNKETDRAGWLVENRDALADAPAMPWSSLQPLLVADGIADLLQWVGASQPGSQSVAHCRRLLDRPRSELDPPPLVTGDDLIALGIPAGPDYKRLLDRLRAAQLDGEIHNRDEALTMAQKLRGEGGK